MARSEVLLESLISYYSRLGMDGLAVCRATREELRTEQFDYKRLAGRVVGWWSDACEGWWSAMLASGTPPLPTLFVTCRTDSASDGGSLRMPVPGSGEPTITTPARVGGGEALAANVTIEVPHFRDQIALKVSGLGKAQPGTYQAVIHLDKLALALVVIEIQAGAAGAGDGAAGAPSRRVGKGPTKKR